MTCPRFEAFGFDVGRYHDTSGRLPQAGIDYRDSLRERGTPRGWRRGLRVERWRQLDPVRSEGRRAVCPDCLRRT